MGPPIDNVFTRIADAAREKGFGYVLRGLWLNIEAETEFLIHRVRHPGTFRFREEDYEYFWHRYNTTWRNERSVEVPIIQRMVDRHGGKRILEVGNVLSHYFPGAHDILDKYERADGVMNRDILDFHPASGYDLIVAISTLEHVGWDEEPRDPEKISRALNHLRSLLSVGGKVIVTLPLGYNSQMDAMLESGALRFPEQHFFKRVSSRQWAEVTWEEVGGAKYDMAYYGANGLVIGMAENR
jgi:hypothetical protein